MAQDPIQVDSLQIAPLVAGTRIIDYDPISGSVRIQDPVLSSATKVVDLAGLRSIEKVLVVGKGGPGATYNLVQDALDAIPNSASISDPWTILVLPGVYQENVVLEKNGVCLCGLGGVVLQPTVADATLLIQGSVGSVPEYCKVQNIRIENSYAGEECVKIVGGAGSTIGVSGVFIENCELVAAGVGTFPLYAEAVNDVVLSGGSFLGSSATSLVRVLQLHRFVWKGVEGECLGQVDYDSGGVIPSVFGSTYSLSGLEIGNLQTTLQGGGSVSLNNCSTGNVSVFGDQEVDIRASKIGNLTCNGTSQVTLISSSRGTAAGAGILVEQITRGTSIFAASSSETVTFAVGTLNNDYGVSLDYEMAALANVKTKTSAGFIIEFVVPQTGSVNWTVHRRV